MSDVKQVKVDNWGIYFLQRLKHFFNRTDYCDLTLQFQDNAQLKVHRLVLNACTEYFEILERTCEMYEDCLVMPDDLQADVVVPIVNFMYTGQLEFKMDLLEKLYQTSLIMNMPVLTKLLDSHRKKTSNNLFGKRYSRNPETPKQPVSTVTLNNSQTKKRSYTKAFENVSEPQSNKKVVSSSKPDSTYNNGLFGVEASPSAKKVIKDPKPSRYELPAELDDDNIFDNSFTSISYTSKPLMVHPETTKYYSPKKSRLFDEPSGSKRFISGTSTMDIVECRKISSNDMFLDDINESVIENEQPPIKEKKDASQLFDQILINDGPKVSIESKENKQASNLDHAKIISEVLKKYPHLVQSKKNIKLKILNTPSKAKKAEPKVIRPKMEMPDFTYETDVVDSKEAARLIALGAENVKGPWICLICGTPGRALHFTSYYNYRRHLVDVHNEKPVSNICEYCGLKSLKRNYLLHHMYTKHGVEPPPNFSFPKCNVCSYVALTEAFLVKHKLSHTENQHFRCTVCAATFYTSKLLLQHIQKTGHKYTGEKKPTPQCIYCFKYFSRDSNLYAHLKANHYQSAKNDGIIDDSDEEKTFTKLTNENVKSEASKYIEVEIPPHFDNQYENTSFQVEQNADGNIEITKKKPRIITPIAKNKILNPGFSKSQSPNNQKVNIRNVTKNEFLQSPVSSKKEEIILIDNNEYILQDFQLIPKSERQSTNFISNSYHTETVETLPAMSVDPEYSNIQSNTEPAKVILKKSSNLNQPIQIVVSNDEEYKALLSSNHSIIFDDGDSEKAMTVLTAPDTSVGNTIDLNNTQNNDMMIIRENYPINITQSNANENSNIVVVYSHPVDDANKHYQLITTTQSMEAQYVQPSAIITQNYETVTTTAALLDHSHEVTTTIENAWQSEIQQSTDTIAKTSEIQLISNTDTMPATHESNVELAELPEVELTQPQIVEEVHIPEQVPNSEITVMTNEEVSTENVTTESSMPIPSEVLPVTTFEPTSIIPLNTISTISNINEPMIVDSFKEIVNNVEPDINTEHQPEISVEEPSSITDVPMKEGVETDISNIQPAEINDAVEETLAVPCVEENNIRTEVIMEMQKIHETPNTEEAQIEELNPQIVTATPVEEDTKNDEEETIENIARHIGVDPNLIPADNIETPISNEKPVIKEIANLTSEWSEDETDGVTDIINETPGESTVTAPTDTLTDEQPEVATSNDISDVETHNVCEDNTNAENATLITQETDSNQPIPEKETSEISTAPQEKISSLLNEWEDNDSQEENNADEAEVTAIPTEVIKNTTDVVINEVPKVDSKPDIRNLVSDWDEDDEEDNKG